MLRRKPTALTITNEDISAFEEQLARTLAYARYLKTGDDPEGYFRNLQQQQQQQSGVEGGHYYDQDAQMRMQMSNDNQRDRSNNNNNTMSATTTVDPNDELKPLPGDKARIVRSREDRIIGTGNR